MPPRPPAHGGEQRFENQGDAVGSRAWAVSTSAGRRQRHRRRRGSRADRSALVRWLRPRLDCRGCRRRAAPRRDRRAARRIVARIDAPPWKHPHAAECRLGGPVRHLYLRRLTQQHRGGSPGSARYRSPWRGGAATEATRFGSSARHALSGHHVRRTPRGQYAYLPRRPESRRRWPCA